MTVPSYAAYLFGVAVCACWRSAASRAVALRDTPQRHAAHLGTVSGVGWSCRERTKSNKFDLVQVYSSRVSIVVLITLYGCAPSTGICSPSAVMTME